MRSTTQIKRTKRSFYLKRRAIYVLHTPDNLLLPAKRITPYSTLTSVWHQRTNFSYVELSICSQGIQKFSLFLFNLDCWSHDLTVQISSHIKKTILPLNFYQMMRVLMHKRPLCPWLFQKSLLSSRSDCVLKINGLDHLTQ